MVGHVTDAVAAVHLPLPGYQDPHGLGGDPRDAVGGHQDDGGAEHHAPTQQLQPGGDDDDLHQPGEGLSGGGQSGGVLLPPPHYTRAGRAKTREPASNATFILDCKLDVSFLQCCKLQAARCGSVTTPSTN